MERKITENTIITEALELNPNAAAILMSYVKVNILFYGRKHNASGTYIITKQQDQINESGYKTTLNLVRIKGDSL